MNQSKIWVPDFKTADCTPYAYIDDLAVYLALKKAEKTIMRKNKKGNWIKDIFSEVVGISYLRISPSGRSTRRIFAEDTELVRAANSPTHAPRFVSLGSSGFASLAFAHSAQPHCPRQRTRINPYRGLALSARATS